jgi:hypothetical protein
VTEPDVPSDNAAIEAAQASLMANATRHLDETVAALKAKPSFVAVDRVAQAAAAVLVQHVAELEAKADATGWPELEAAWTSWNHYQWREVIR